MTQGTKSGNQRSTSISAAQVLLFDILFNYLTKFEAQSSSGRLIILSALIYPQVLGYDLLLTSSIFSGSNGKKFISCIISFTGVAKFLKPQYRFSNSIVVQ